MKAQDLSCPVAESTGTVHSAYLCYHPNAATIGTRESGLDQTIIAHI